MHLESLSFDLASLRHAYANGASVRAVMAEARRRCAQDDRNVFIHRLSEAEMEPFLAALAGADPASLPLYGVPLPSRTTSIWPAFPPLLPARSSPTSRNAAPSWCSSSSQPARCQWARPTWTSSPPG